MAYSKIITGCASYGDRTNAEVEGASGPAKGTETADGPVEEEPSVHSNGSLMLAIWLALSCSINA